MAGRLPARFSTEKPEETLDCCRRKKTVKGALAAFVLLCLICTLFGTTGADTAKPRLSGTYLQLMRHHLAWDEENWKHLFEDFNTLRINRLILQWTVSSDLAFYPSETFQCEEKSPLELILKLADESGIGVYMGLWHDPNFWNNIEGPADLLEAYFQRSRYRCTSIAKELAPIARNHPSFQGWYISEEIDDTSWDEPTRREMLLDHLTILRADLRKITPDAEVGISGFSNTRLDPESFGEFWEKILAESAIDTLYFQDGIGVHKLELNYLPLYLEAADHAARNTNRELSVVVELFEQKMEKGDHGEEFQAVPAPLSRIERQIELAGRYAGDRITAFSVPDYMQSSGNDASRRLYRDYVEKYIESDRSGAAH